MHLLQVTKAGEVIATPPRLISCVARWHLCECELCKLRADVARCLAILEPYANSSRIISAEIDLYREYKEIRARI